MKKSILIALLATIGTGSVTSYADMAGAGLTSQAAAPEKTGFFSRMKAHASNALATLHKHATTLGTSVRRATLGYSTKDLEIEFRDSLNDANLIADARIPSVEKFAKIVAKSNNKQAFMDFLDRVVSIVKKAHGYMGGLEYKTSNDALESAAVFTQGSQAVEADLRKLTAITPADKNEDAVIQYLIQFGHKVQESLELCAHIHTAKGMELAKQDNSGTKKTPPAPPMSRKAKAASMLSSSVTPPATAPAPTGSSTPPPPPPMMKDASGNLVSGKKAGVTPPPPPPMPSGSLVSTKRPAGIPAAQEGRGGLLDSIRAGKTLKKTDAPAPQPTKKSASAVGATKGPGISLDALSGAKLKGRSQQKPLAAKQETEGEKQMRIMREKAEARRKALEGNDE